MDNPALRLSEVLDWLYKIQCTITFYFHTHADIWTHHISTRYNAATHLEYFVYKKD